MESPNLTSLEKFSLKGLTNRYCMCCIKYPDNSYQVISDLVESDKSEKDYPFNRRESIDENFQVEGESFVYSTNKTVFSIEVKQPTYVHQQICLNFEKDLTMISSIQCLTAFPLPSHYSSSQSNLPISTCILIVYDGKKELSSDNQQNQMIKMYEDRGKEILFDFVKDGEKSLYQDRIIWVTSHYIPVEKGSLVLLIFGYANCKVNIFSLEFDQPTNDISRSSNVIVVPTISSLVNYKFNDIVLFNDIFLVKCSYIDEQTLIDFKICFTSFDGQISLCQLKLLATLNVYHQYKLSLQNSNIETMTINRQLSQPKFFQQKQYLDQDFYLHDTKSQEQVNNLLYLVIPIQNAELLCFTDVVEQGLKKYQKVKLREENLIKQLVTAFDVHEKRHECQIQSAGSFEICLMHFDGSLQIYKMTMIENQILISLQLMKQLNYSRFFLNSSQFSFKQFILLGSEEEMEVYEMSFYQIN